MQDDVYVDLFYTLHRYCLDQFCDKTYVDTKQWHMFEQMYCSYQSALIFKLIVISFRTRPHGMMDGILLGIERRHVLELK